MAYLKESHFLLEVCYGPTKGRHEDQPVVAMTKPPQSWFSALHHRNSLQADVNCLGFAANEIDTSNVGSLDSSLGRAVGCVLDKCQQKWGWKPLLTGEGGTSLFSGIVPFRRVITYFRLLECNGVLYAVLFGWGAPLFPGIVLSVFFWVSLSSTIHQEVPAQDDVMMVFILAFLHHKRKRTPQKCRQTHIHHQLLQKSFKNP